MSDRLRRSPEEFAREDYDLIVVGGGIHGACLLLRAASAGLRSILLERSDFGGGVSWNSMRILHGGLRYLQSLDLRRSRQSISARRWFMRSFPDHVGVLPCLMPLYGRGLRRRSILGAALAVNDLLSADRNRGVPPRLHLPRGELLSPSEVRARVPTVERDGLEGGAVWYDAVLENPSRIMMEILRSAARLGGRALNYAGVRRILVENGRVAGVVVGDRVEDRELHFRASRVAVCVGAGFEEPRVPGSRRGQPASPPRALAFNVVLRGNAPAGPALAVRAGDASDGTPGPDAPTYFIHSLDGVTLAGTAHAAWEGHLPRDASDPLVRRFLEDLNRSVPGWDVRERDVARVLAGVLPASDADSRHPASRESIVAHRRLGGPRGLISVFGVKYTTAPDVAAQALRAVFPDAVPEARGRPADLDTVAPLELADFEELSDRDPTAAAGFVRRFVEDEAVRTPEDLVCRRMDWGLDPASARVASELVGRYMSRLPDLLRPDAPPSSSREDLQPGGS